MPSREEVLIEEAYGDAFKVHFVDIYRMLVSGISLDEATSKYETGLKFLRMARAAALQSAGKPAS